MIYDHIAQSTGRGMQRFGGTCRLNVCTLCTSSILLFRPRHPSLSRAHDWHSSTPFQCRKKSYNVGLPIHFSLGLTIISAAPHMPYTSMSYYYCILRNTQKRSQTSALCHLNPALPSLPPPAPLLYPFVRPLLLVHYFPSPLGWPALRVVATTAAQTKHSGCCVAV